VISTSSYARESNKTLSPNRGALPSDPLSLRCLEWASRFGDLQGHPQDEIISSE
jgi:hypothetical protein